MNEEANGVKGPRRLVVNFYGDGYSSYLDDMIGGGGNNHLQLVHKQRFRHPPLLDQLLIRFRLKSRSTYMLSAVEEAHKFLTRNYQPGDQVILLAYCYSPKEAPFESLAVLARNLAGRITPPQPWYRRTKPTRTIEPSRMGREGEMDISGQPIPIYAVILNALMSVDSISSLNIQMQSRFPPGVEYIISHGGNSGEYASCSIRCDSAGAIVSKEICLYNNAYTSWPTFAYATRDVIYYGPQWIPNWDELEPVWIHVLNSTGSDTERMLPLQTVLPVGMYLHELRKYERVPHEWPHGSGRPLDMLIWRSSRR
ncbi:hypothetical protein OPQ81_001051 [Rhizoctonia solani]|nr:hypothetical protein OPQ81_001051 [Rhizoctonia solani]